MQSPMKADWATIQISPTDINTTEECGAALNGSYPLNDAQAMKNKEANASGKRQESQYFIFHYPKSLEHLA